MFGKEKDHVSYEIKFDKYKVVQKDVLTAIEKLSKYVKFKDSDKINITKVKAKIKEKKMVKEPETLTYVEVKKKYLKKKYFK